jgi:hypothetical protein
VGNYCADVTETTTIGMNVPILSRQITTHKTDQFWTQSPTQPYNNLFDNYYVNDVKDGVKDEEKDEEKDGVNTLINGYEMSQNTDTPYSTPALLGIMREISAPPVAPTQLRYFFQDDDYLK